MKTILKNIFNLSKLFIKENDKNIVLINLDKKSINKKSVMFWMYIVLFLGVFYISSKIIDYTIAIGKPQIFLNGFLLFLGILIIFKTIIISMNVFYFSKDIEDILHLPFKPIEILISKFNTVLFINYEIELVIAFVPLLLYQIRTYTSIPNIFNYIVILLIFPIFATLIVSILMIILMKSIKLFKNKDTMQIVLSYILTIIIMIVVSFSINYIFNNMEFVNKNPEIFINTINEKIINVNKYFLGINQTADILQENSLLIKIINYGVLFAINIISFLIFVFIGKKLYLEQLLKAKFYYKKIRNKKINLNKQCKKNRVGKSYIEKEFKLLTKNPLFLIQSIYPVIIFTVVISVLIIFLVPVVRESIKNETYADIRDNLKFNMEAVCIIIGTIQVVGLFNYTSITSFSREGKNAYIIKTLPVSIYKQFIYKTIPQIIINSICSIIIFGVINFKIQEIGIKYILIMLLLSIMVTIINSYILCLIDLLMPKLDWNGEYEILKNSKNKLLQYVLIIVNIIFFINVNNVLKRYNLNVSLSILSGFIIVEFIILNISIYKLKNRLFDKIN